MNRQTLTDARYHTIGYIGTATDGRQTARNARLHALGDYEPHTGTTRDAQRHFVGKGNLLASLACSPPRNRSSKRASTLVAPWPSPTSCCRSSRGRRWRMVEVKSATRLKGYHRDDAAIRAFVAHAAGSGPS